MKDSVANVSQLATLDKAALQGPVGRLSQAELQLVLVGIDVALGC